MEEKNMEIVDVKVDPLMAYFADAILALEELIALVPDVNGGKNDGT